MPSDEELFEKVSRLTGRLRQRTTWLIARLYGLPSRSSFRRRRMLSFLLIWGVAPRRGLLAL